MSRTLALVFLLASSAFGRAETLQVDSLHTQRRGDAVYFAACLRPSRDWGKWDLQASDRLVRYEGQRRRLARLPRLVPQDDFTSAVYLELDPLPAEKGHLTLRFVGKTHEKRKANLLLIYPATKTASDKKAPLRKLLSQSGWVETPLTLDFRQATAMKPFSGLRNANGLPATEDLEGRWAVAQAGQLAILETQTRDFSFFGLARTLTGRKYQVQATSFVAQNIATREKAAQQLFEMTTGAAAVTESLALARLRSTTASDRGKRSIDIENLPGIDIAEHPWEKMMGEQKPDPEPLADLTPHNFYYASFRTIGALLDLGDLVDQWGDNLLQGYEITSRDYQVRQRYEKQLCLLRTELARKLGPALLRGVALIGSDLYVREGSDVTVLFHVRNRALFLAAVEPFLQAARNEFGDRLKKRKTEYHGTTIESFVTPPREVSLYRAAVGDFVIYSNSPAAMRRVLDTQAGRCLSLAQSLDFQYMRTVFRKSNKEEDGFAFLSDAFIRRLVGPASKIKEKRRLEALTSLRMMTDAALFVAWETGRLPADRAALLKASGLKAEEIDVPEGGALVWDGESQTAISDIYNSLAFATPLIELAIDKVTPVEANLYRNFRRQYLDLWRRYFDPVGMRLSLRDKRVRVETYILPLIESNGYRDLRQMTGEGTTKLDLASLSPRTLAQLTAHFGLARSFIELGHDGALGDQIFVRCDDSPKFRALIELWMRHDFEPGDPSDEREWERLIVRAACRVPVTVGVRIGTKKAFDDWLKELGRLLNTKATALKPPYKGVSIRRFPLEFFAEVFNASGTSQEKRFIPVLYHASVDSFWYVSTSLDSLRDTIDRAVARREQRDKGEQTELNSSLYLAPEAMLAAAAAYQGYLEWESHRRAVANNPFWYVLRRGGAVKNFDSSDAQQAARRFFGFVPVSPDASPYRFDALRQEVRNERYGSLHHPKVRSTLPESSPLAQLLEKVRTLRVDLRFREDGVHTILTIDRHGPKK